MRSDPTVDNARRARRHLTNDREGTYGERRPRIPVHAVMLAKLYDSVEVHERPAPRTPTDKSSHASDENSLRDDGPVPDLPSEEATQLRSSARPRRPAMQLLRPRSPGTDARRRRGRRPPMATSREDARLLQRCGWRANGRLRSPANYTTFWNATSSLRGGGDVGRWRLDHLRGRGHRALPRPGHLPRRPPGRAQGVDDRLEDGPQEATTDRGAAAAQAVARPRAVAGAGAHGG